MDDTRDWVSRLLEMIPVKGTLDYRCFLGAPWRIDFPASELALSRDTRRRGRHVAAETLKKSMGL